MSTVLLLPRLPFLHAARLLEEFRLKTPLPVFSLSELTEFNNRITYAPSGGHRSPETALGLAGELRRLAESCGFPSGNSTMNRSRFDSEATKLLAGHHALGTGEALRDDVWACLAMVFLPDVVDWRFRGYPRERYLGGVRNTFQRLWERGIVLDRGEGIDNRWQLVEKLSEDAMVQILERASISGHPGLSRVIAEKWVATTETVPLGKMEDIMRKAMKIIRLRNEIYDYPSTKEDYLMDEIDNIFSVVAAEFRK